MGYKIRTSNYLVIFCFSKVEDVKGEFVRGGKIHSYTEPLTFNILHLSYALILDIFENDEAIVEFMGLWEGIPSEYHKASFTIDLDHMVYFGEFVHPSSCKNKNDKIENVGL